MARSTFLKSILESSACALALGTMALGTGAHAQVRHFNVPRGELKQALDAYARQADIEIFYRIDDVRGRASAGIEGDADAREALDRLLAGSGLIATRDTSGVVAVAQRPQSNGGEGRVSPEEAVQVDDIVVTANRREQRLQNVPSSITAETGGELARRGASQMEDIVNIAPGLSNPSSGGANKINLTIRGVATSADPGLKQSTVAVLFGDVPLDPGAGALGATNLRFVDVERIEVLRGPQGTLFGSGSLSGALRVVPRRPDLGAFGGDMELTGSETRDGASSVSGHLTLNAPLVEDRLAVRVVGYGFEEGGWVDNRRTGEKDVNGSETYGGRLAVAARPNDRLTADLLLAYQNGHDEGAGESLYSPAAGADDPYAVTDVRKSQDSRIESQLINLTLGYGFDAFSLTSSSTLVRRESELNDDVGYYNDLLALQLGLRGLTGAAPSLTANDADIFTQELRLASKPGGRLQWTVGAFYLKVNGSGGQWVTSPPLAAVLGSGNLATLTTDGEQEEIAGFGEVTYALTDRLEVTAGLRVSDTSLHYDTHASGLLLTGSPNPALTVATVVEQGETATNPRVALSYRPSETLTLYAQAARGYRVGGPNQTAGLGGPNIPRSYDSDHLWNYEVGAKGSLNDGAVRFSAAAYLIDWSDMQTNLRLNNVAYVGNAGAARIRGLELEASARLTSNLEVGGSAAFNRAETDSDVPNLVRRNGVVGVKAGYRLPASPELQLSAYAQQRFQVFGHAAWIRSDTQYVGDQFTDYDEAGTRFGDYTNVNLRAGVQLDRVELIGFASNLFDSRGERAATELSMAGPIVAQSQMAYRLRPRTLGLTLRTAF